MTKAYPVANDTRNASAFQVPASTYSQQAEEALTSAASAGYDDATAQVLTLLADDFCGDVSRPLAEAIHGLAKEGASIDAVTVLDWLERHNKLSDALGQSTIIGMARDAMQDYQCNATAFQGWANIIRDCAIGRAESSYHTLLADAAIRRVEPSEKDIAPYRQALERLRAGRQSSLLSIDDLLQEAPIPYIVDGILPALALAMCHADESQLKSFVVLDLLCHIATGKAWHGRKIKTPGKVVLVVGEGGNGIVKRLRAWAQLHHVSLPELSKAVFIRKPGRGLPPFALLERGHVETLLADMKKIGDVVAVAFDTLSSILPGVDMNGGSAGEMLEAESLARRIVAEAGVTCLFVHHNNGAGLGPRGATSFRNAMDIRFSTKAEKNLQGLPQSVTVHCEKPRDDAPFADMVFNVHVVPTPTEDDPNSTSLALEADYSTPEQAETKEERQYRQLLTILYNQGASANSGKWESDARLFQGINHVDYVNAVRDMRNLGYISKGSGKQDPYQITAKGLEYIGHGPTPPDNSPVKQSEQSEIVQNYSYHSDSSGRNNSRIVSDSLESDYPTIISTVATDPTTISKNSASHVVMPSVGANALQPQEATISNLEAEREKRSASNPKIPAQPKQAPMGLRSRIMDYAQRVNYASVLLSRDNTAGGSRAAWQAFCDACLDYDVLVIAEKALKEKAQR